MRLIDILGTSLIIAGLSAPANAQSDDENLKAALTYILNGNTYDDPLLSFDTKECVVTRLPLPGADKHTGKEAFLADLAGLSQSKQYFFRQVDIANPKIQVRQVVNPFGQMHIVNGMYHTDTEPQQFIVLQGDTEEHTISFPFGGDTDRLTKALGYILSRCPYEGKKLPF